MTFDFVLGFAFGLLILVVVVMLRAPEMDECERTHGVPCVLAAVPANSTQSPQIAHAD